MKKLYTALRYVGTFPSDVLAWLLILAIHVLWGQNLRWEAGCLCTTLKPSSKPARTWYSAWGGTTFGHAIMFNADADPIIPKHEHVHVRQFEYQGMYGLWIGLAILAFTQVWWLALGVWTTCGWMLYASASFNARLHGQNRYQGNPLEEAAYATQEGVDIHA